MITLTALACATTAAAKAGPAPTGGPETHLEATKIPSAGETPGAEPTRRLSPLDWLVIAAYAAGMLAVGWYYSRKAKSSDDYLLGGRQMKSFMVGLSLFASLVSAISYLATPGEMIKYGPGILWGQASIPLVFLVTGYLLIPHIMKLPVTSAYEILEGRLGFRIRLMGSAIFLLIRLVWMSLLIYLTADKVIVTIMGWSPRMTPLVCAIIGLITVTYTSRGGLRAVVLTDCIQACILFGGAILTILLITHRMGGVGAWWPRAWAPHWKPQPFFSISPYVRVTVVGAILSDLVWWICTCGSDQLAIQRYLSTRSPAAARRSFLVTSIAGVAVTAVLAVMGFALLGYYRLHPQLAPPGVSVTSSADRLFPHFISTDLPAGIAGLLIAGLLAAAMGALSSGINSVCAVIVTDLIGPFRRKGSHSFCRDGPPGASHKTNLTPSRDVATAKAVSLGVGVLVVLMSLLMSRIPGNLIEVTSKTSNLFVVPLFGLFFMAMFVPFATPFGTAFGSLYGLLAAALIAFWDVLTGRAGLSFQWILPVPLVVTIVAGCGLSLLPTRGRGWSTLGAWTVAAAAPAVIALAVLIRGVP